MALGEEAVLCSALWSTAAGAQSDTFDPLKSLALKPSVSTSALMRQGAPSLSFAFGAFLLPPALALAPFFFAPLSAGA